MDLEGLMGNEYVRMRGIVEQGEVLKGICKDSMDFTYICNGGSGFSVINPVLQ